MAAPDGSVTINTKVNNNGFNKGIKQMKSEVGGLNNTLLKVGKTIASVFAVKELIRFGKAAIDLGSDVQEVQNVVDTAFGDMAYKAEAFASTAITQFGMSTLAAKKTASNYMAMARGMGVVPEAASDMSIALAGLSGDVASFYNLSQEEAALKLAGVFTGEGEALKSIGVVMTEANLEAFALSQGMKKQYKDMSQAEKVALRYSFVMDSLNLAQGDFAKTSTGWANQTRILSMQWQEFMSIIGQALITVLRPLVIVLNQIVGYMIGVANAINSFVTSVFGKAEQQTESVGTAASESISEATASQNELTAATKKTAKEQKKTISSFDEINKLSSSGSGSKDKKDDASAGGMSFDIPSLELNTKETEEDVDVIGGFFKELGKTIASIFPNTLTSIQNFFGTLQGIWTDIVSLGDPIAEWFKGYDLRGFVSTSLGFVETYYSGVVDVYDTVIGDVWDKFLFPTLDFGLEEGLPRITQLFTELVATGETAFSGLKTIFDTLWEGVFAPGLELLATRWNDLWGVIFGFWDTYGAPIFEKIRTAIDKFVGIVMNLWNKCLGPVFKKLFTAITDLWNNKLKPLFEKLGVFIGELITFLLNLWNNVLAPIINWLIDVLGPVFAKTFGDIVDVISRVCGKIADDVNSILDIFNGILSFLNDIFATDWAKVWDDIKSIPGRAWEWIKGVWEGVATWFDTKVVQPIASFFGGLWTGIKTAGGALADWMKKKVIDPIVNLFKKLYNSLVGIVEGVINGFIGVINGFISGINLAIEKINAIPGVNIPLLKTIPKVSIPRLAQGAVIPPNREFMAVLGDQKSGTNIETPLATMVQAFKQALGETGGGGGQTIILQIDGREFGRAVKKYGSREDQRIGVSLVGVRG